MKRQANEYELIVLGTGLAGLIAGTLLSIKNHEVLLLKEKKYHSFFTKEGYRFPPFSNFLKKRLKLNFILKLAQALGLSLFSGDREEERWVQTRPGKPKEKVSFQVILPKARIDLFYKTLLFQKELEREFPKETAQIETFYQEMGQIRQLLKTMEAEESSGLFFPVMARSLIKRWLKFENLPKGRMDERLSLFSKEFREFIQLQLISLGNLHSNQFPISLAAYLLFSDEKDEWASEMDVEKLKETIFGKYFQSGGRVEEIEGVEKVEMRRRREFILSIKGRQGLLRSNLILLNSPLHRLSNLLGRKEKVLSPWREKVKPHSMLIPLFLGIREKAMPVGMRDLLVSILDLNKPYEGGNVLFISISRKGDETEAPEGKRALAVQSLWDQNSFTEHQKGVMEHLHHLFPFLEKYIEFADWSWAEEQSSCWSYPHFLYEAAPGFLWREGVAPTHISKNLYFTGKENFPYLGLEGEVLSGLMVGQQILQKLS
jgi:phytoene dehydrogenase-like protein